MDIVPILQTLRLNKGTLALLMLQTSFTLAVLVNSLVIIESYVSRLTLETGINDRAVIAIEVEPVERGYFSEQGRVRNDVRQDIDHLKQIPGLKSIAQVDSFPLSGEGAMRPSWPLGTDKEKAVRHSVFAGDEQTLSALGLNLVAGRAFSAEEAHWLDDPLRGERAAVVIISRELADMLFPDGDAVGKQLETDGGGIDTVIGVVDRLPGRHILMNTIKLGALVPARPLKSIRYAISTDASAGPELLSSINNTLVARDGERDIRVDTLLARKKQSMHYLFLFGSILGVISALLILVTAIGAYSQAMYSVTKRVREIGTRRAFGASKWHVLRYFLLENWLTTSLGLVFGLLIASGLSFVLTETMQLPKVGWAQLSIGMLFLWLVGFLSTLLPALNATSVPPAIATRGAV